MNKGNKTLVGILAFVLVCVVGYALFGENINVTGSATASGDWGITATCQPGIPSLIGSAADDLLYHKEGGFSSDTCNVTDGTKVKFNTNLLYPSSARHFTVKFTNTGNVNATIDMSGNAEIFETVIFKNESSEVCEINSSNQKVNCSDRLTYDTGRSNFISDSILGFSDASGKFYSTDEVDEFINSDTGVVALESGESIYVALTIYWDEDYVSNTNSAHLSFEVNADVDFIQATE